MATPQANPKFKKVRDVTLQLFKLEKNTLRYFRFEGPMHLGKRIDEQKEPATLAKVTDLESGEVGQIICPAILQKELNENYPGETYVRKCFEISLTRVPEKRYNLVTVAEVGDPTDAAPVETTPAKAKSK